MQQDNPSQSSNKNEPKHIARLLAVQYLYTEFINKKNAKEDYLFFEPNTLLSELEKNKFDNKLYEALIDGVNKYSSPIDDVIVKLAPAWPLDQINPVNRIILEAAIWEAFIEELTPAKVAIDQAIELAKAFSTQSNFINGVLANIYNNEEIKTNLKALKNTSENE